MRRGGETRSLFPPTADALFNIFRKGSGKVVGAVILAHILDAWCLTTFHSAPWITIISRVDGCSAARKWVSRQFFPRSFFYIIVYFIDGLFNTLALLRMFAAFSKSPSKKPFPTVSPLPKPMFLLLQNRNHLLVTFDLEFRHMFYACQNSGMHQWLSSENLGLAPVLISRSN